MNLPRVNVVRITGLAMSRLVEEQSGQDHAADRPHPGFSPVLVADDLCRTGRSWLRGAYQADTAGLKARAFSRSRLGRHVPRFFFDIHDGDDIRDDAGHDLPDLKAVRAEAQRALAGMVATTPLDTNAIQIRVDVRDESGKRVVTASLLAVVKDAP
jgi:hypothetical protein